jgi:DNA-binding transcriptional LysR family regulator
MASRLPPLNPLRAFEATARRGAVSAAARELNVTHGAVSHQIRALEESLGTVLFERGGKRLKLTPQGALLLPAVTNAFGEIAAATALMKQPETRAPVALAHPAPQHLHRPVPRRACDADRLQRSRQSALARHGCQRALRRWQLAGLLDAALVASPALSGGEPDAAQQPAAALGARSFRPHAVPRRRRARMEHLAGGGGCDRRGARASIS